MDFARKQLEKYGWLEGEGLGKNRDGITKALKPKLKFDNAGLGHDICDDLDNPWWQRLYNEAANNIVTNERNKEVVIELKGDPIEVTTRKLKKKSLNDKNKKYKGFVKISELDGTKEKICKDVETDCQEKEATNQNKTDMFGIDSEELFKICGGRTAHKGARHGLKMSAKLSRIMDQERNLMTAANSKSIGNFINIGTITSKKEKKKKKMKKEKKDRQKNFHDLLENE